MRHWYLSGFYFFYFISLGIVVPYWSLHLKYLGFNATEIGQLMSILLVTKVIAPNIWAAVADRMVYERGSSVALLQFATIATVAFYCLMFWAQSFWAVAAVMFAYCVFWNACLPQVEAATLNYFKSQDTQDAREYRYGSIRLWGSVGFIVSVLGIGALMDIYGPKVVLPAGVIGLLSIAIISFWMRSDNQKPRFESATSVPITALLNFKILTLFILCIVMQMTHAPFYTFFSIYLESYHYSKTHIGILWSIGVVFEIVIFLFGYRLMRYYRLAHLLTFTFAVASLRWFLVADFPENSGIILFSQVLHAFTYGLYHSIMIQLIDRFFQGRFQIRGQALYSSITFGIGGAVGSLLSGYVWTSYGGNVLFLSAACLMLAITVVSLIITPRITRVSAQPL